MSATVPPTAHQRAMRKLAVLALVGVVLLVAVAVAGPIKAGPTFHHYADQRQWLGIPHVGDVVSNVVFLLVAAWTWRRYLPSAGNNAAVVIAPRLFAAATLAVGAIGLGSALYHVSPNDLGLFCDWVPIATALMLLLACMIEDRVAKTTLAPWVLVALAPTSVAVWYFGGAATVGDMRWYVAVQGGGIAMTLGLALVTRGQARTRWVVLAVAAFLLARVAHRYDRQLLVATGVSGHAFKHVIAALAAGAGLAAFGRK